ncbi:DUF6470 family protein [Geobacillus stearothermophilus]|uniref:DUF6470 family protein n=1 Tax=Geobacillus stearothermophilus TaxID=1422 RepID=UPI002E222CDB|nr:DUF6470 family protein [Geobacillus stearothermophilus]MED3730063.1 DUF6470 family protein [Geobacillus stearothermophilus]MED3747281.1 DUF6470 family protein [Geobacillus stearothermophilus]MED3753191.1 DUF6470 family protein [Geobacillus stearothermophilus]MED3770272.1 DUF6470 family protein [Geobacillus stearothermophilus]
MQLPQIRLQSTMAKIAIETVPAKLEIQQPPAELEIEQSPARLTIRTTPSKLTIDQTKAWEDMNLEHIFRRIEKFAEQGYNDWLDGLARVSRQGDELMRIEDGGNPIAEQAKENSETPMYEFNIGWVPSPFSVHISYTPADVDIRFETHKPVIRARTHPPVIRYMPGEVAIRLAQRPSLHIDVVI